MSKLSPFSSILKEYLGSLESTKRFSKEQLLGQQINLVKNCMRLKEQSDSLYRQFISDIISLYEQVYRAHSGSSTTKTIAEKDAKKRADYWSNHSTKLSVKLDLLNDNKDQISQEYSFFLQKVD